jgi:hypothetical protein
MNIYFLNSLDKCSLSSVEIDGTSNIKNIYDNYLNLYAEFVSDNITISGIWNDPVPIDSFIIGITNAAKMSLNIYNSNDKLLYSKENSEIEKPYDIHSFNPFIAKSFEVNLSNPGIPQDLIKIGYMYAGIKIQLDSFTTFPMSGYQLGQNSQRSFGGQSYGLQDVILRREQVLFLRVMDKTVLEYIKTVGKTVPHLIDLYPEAHEWKEPLYCTIDEDLSQEKRDENGFYMNYSLSWLEAK